MTPGEWLSIKPVLNSALELPAGQRESFLQREISDAALRDEVRSLIASHDADELFAETPVGVLLDQRASGPALPRYIQQYEIVRPLASGGMSEVYLATDHALGRAVALKVLSAEFSEDSDRVRRLEQEARAASSLNNPNIVTVYELGRAGSTSFIAEEFVEGVTLRERLQSGPMPLAEVICIAVQVTRALSAAHSAGVIHRDVKPENIMIRHDGLVKVLDFGLAKCLTARAGSQVDTSAGLILGTVQYMSPEQMRGLDVDVRTDLWSLGVVIYEMLARSRPFDATTTSDAIVRILQEDPPPLVGLASPELQDILRKALSKERSSRYSSADELARDLNAVRVHGPFDRSSIRAGRWKVAATAAALIVALGVAGWKVGSSVPAPVRPPPARMMLAVLPFATVGANAGQDYFTDGLTEDTTTELGRLAPEELGVIARTSTIRYRATQLDVRTIGRQLGVDYVIEGSVRRDGDRIRVAAQLVQTSDGTHVWAETYERKLEDAFTLQSELAREVARQVKVRIAPRGSARESALPRTEVGREAFMRGRYEMQFGKLENREKALKYFAEAAAAEPEVALVHTEIARATLSLATFRYAPRDVVPAARRSALKALELDDQLAEAHHAMGMILLEYDWKWDAAERELKRAIELNPNLSVARATYASLLITSGRFEEGLQESARAMALDPLSPGQHEQMVWQWTSARRWKEAVEQSRRMLDTEPTRMRSYHTLAIASLALGDERTAIEAADHQVAMSDVPIDRANAAYVYARVGRIADARKLLNELETLAAERYVCAYQLATIHGALGELDLAFADLEQGFKDDSG